MSEKTMPVTNDLIFQRIFGKVGNENITKGFLEKLLGIEEYHTKWSIQEEKYRKNKFTEDLEIHMMELKKFDTRKNENPEDNWIRFIKARGKEEMKKLIDVDKMLAEAIEEFNNLQDSPEMHEEFEWRQKELRDKISFATAAKEEGIEERSGKTERKKSKKKL